MIAVLPSLRTSLKKKTFLGEVNHTISVNVTKNSTEVNALKKKNHTKKVGNNTILKNLTGNSNHSALVNKINLLKRDANKTKSVNSTNHSSTLNKTNTTNVNLTDNSTDSTDCEEVEFYIRIEKEVQTHITHVKAIFIDHSKLLEKKINSEKNVIKREIYKRQLNDLVNEDLESLRVIEELFNDMVKETLNLKNQFCKKEALKQLKATKRHINSFIQTMNGVLIRSGENSKKVSFL
jgi:hypothetical protein